MRALLLDLRLQTCIYMSLIVRLTFEVVMAIDFMHAKSSDTYVMNMAKLSV